MSQELNARKSGRNNLVIMTIIVLALLGIFWIGIAVLEVVLAFLGRPGLGPDLGLILLALWNLLVSILNLLEIRGVRKGYRATRKSLGFLSVLGVLLTIWGVMQGIWLQFFPLLLYVLLGILLVVNKDHYTELPPKEIKKQARKVGSNANDGLTNVNAGPMIESNTTAEASRMLRATELSESPQAGPGKSSRTWLVVALAAVGSVICLVLACIVGWNVVAPDLSRTLSGAALTPSATVSITDLSTSTPAIKLPTRVPASPQDAGSDSASRQVSQHLLVSIQPDTVVDGSARISPDGRHLAGVMKVGNRRLVTVDSQRQSEYDDIVADSLVFSPDSQHVAYIAKVGQTYMTVRDGVAEKAYGQIQADSLTFSPDSHHLAYSAGDANGGTVVRDGKELERHDELGALVFSPDSQQLAYAAGSKGFFGIGESWVVLWEQTRYEGYTGIGQLLFSPDSTHLGFEAAKDGKQVVAVDGVVSKPYDNLGPMSFSPDSRNWTYRAGVGGKQFAVRDEQTGEMFDEIDNPHFSPDSQHIAYGARAGGSWLLVTDQVKSKSYDEVFAQLPLFSPDSKHVAFAAKQGDQEFIVRDGQADKPYYAIILNQVVFSPDSQSLVYGATEDGQASIVMNGIAGRFYQGVWAPIFSPNGKHMAYVAEEENHAFVIVDGVRRQIFDSILSDSLHFDPDGSLHYLASNGNDVSLVEEVIQ